MIAFYRMVNAVSVMMFGFFFLFGIWYFVRHHWPTPTPTPAPIMIFKVTEIDSTNGLAYGIAYWHPTVTESNGVWEIKFEKIKEPK